MNALDELAGVETLQGVLDWARRQGPEIQLIDVVEQDEYSLDVIFAWLDATHLAFDTT